MILPGGLLLLIVLEAFFYYYYFALIFFSFVFILSIWLLHFGGCVDDLSVHLFSFPLSIKKGYRHYFVETYSKRRVDRD